jgi:orotate phosphoribosyltransferase
VPGRWYDLVIEDLAAAEAAWEARAVEALREAGGYRELALAALERLESVTQQLVRERQMRLALADELRRYTARQVAGRAA